MENRADAETSSFSSSLFAAVSHGFASMAMVFINKAVLMQYTLHEPEALMVYVSILGQQAKIGDALEILSGKWDHF
ncbi:hypothetical protein RYX36_004511 [Vicia faba]